MEAEENKEEVLTQGKVYNPQGSIYEQAVASKELDLEAATAETPEKSQEVVSSNSMDFIKKNPLIVLGAGIAVIVIIVTVAVLASVSAKKKQEAEELARAEELLNYDESEYVTFSYTSDELSELRKAGYTGDEIETYELQEIDAQYLIETAAAERQALYEEEILPYFNSASDEFKQLWRDTWIGQDELTLNDDPYSYMYYAETVNVDYEKISPTGYQLFIKYWLPNDSTTCFMTLTPERYSLLDDSGNMVIKITYTMNEDGDKIITSAEEYIP